MRLRLNGMNGIFLKSRNSTLRSYGTLNKMIMFFYQPVVPTEQGRPRDYHRKVEKKY